MSATQSTTELYTVEIPFRERFMHEVRPPSDWEDWLALATESKSIQQKLGLLHGIFEFEMGRGDWDTNLGEHGGYREYSNVDRLEVLFAIADGWNDHYAFQTQGVSSRDEPTYMMGYDKKQERRIQKSVRELRQMLARKAFDLLCLNFFRMDEPSPHSDRERIETDWLQRIVVSRVFPTIQQFFRITVDTIMHRSEIRNLSYCDNQRSNNEKSAVEFLLKLPKILWEWRSGRTGDESKEAEVRARVDTAKPWMLDVLSTLGELRLMQHEWILALDAPCLAKLREVALRNEINHCYNPVRESRNVASLEEACYVGSKAAWLLKQHELMIREHERLSVIQNAEWALEKAKRVIAERTKA